jgi:Ca2+-binding EF-hand superfamily protein
MDANEVKELMVAMGFTADDAYATAALKKFDTDGDGTLSSGEFGALFEFLRKQAAAATATTAQAGGSVSIQKFDTDGSGSLDVKEVGAMLVELGFEANEEYTKQVMVKFDQNQDGRLDASEFARLYAFCLENGGRDGD